MGPIPHGARSGTVVSREKARVGADPKRAVIARTLLAPRRKHEDMNRTHYALVAALLSVVFMFATGSLAGLVGLFVSMALAGWEFGKAHIPAEA